MENNEIIMDEVIVDEVEVIAENSGVNFAKIGLGVLAVGAVVALGYQAYKVVKAKRAARKAREELDDSAIEVEDFEAVDTDK